MPQFQTTRWSLVAQGCDGANSDLRMGALDEICSLYSKPLRWYGRRFGLTESDAEDQVQEFLSKLSSRNYLKQADSRRGKLRTFLLASFKNHLLDFSKSQNAVKRGGEVEWAHNIDLDSIPGVLEVEFDRNWAETILDSVLVDLQNQAKEKGRSPLFRSLKPYLTGDGERGLATIAIEHDMQEGAVRLALHRLRKKFREQLRLEVSQTLAPDDDLEEELRYLAETLS